jgi:signal peptidase I
VRSAAALVAAVGLCAACSGADTDTRIYRVPSSSMEPTLHCARPALGCEANDVLELDTGLLLPMVEDCIREVDLEGGRILVAPGFADPG